jgi:beta-galactosidase/beta-glucuronidase
MEKLLPWTEFSDPKALNFAGTATYSTAFNLPESTVHNYLLDLGKVYESAKVWINGEEAGYIWSHPFTIDISHLLKSGENLLEIEVANLSTNRIRWMDQQGIIWRNYHEINFVNINYKPFDASGWDVMPSGLEGPVTLFKY